MPPLSGYGPIRIPRIDPAWSFTPVNEINDLALSHDAIRNQLTHVLRSPLFAQSDRLGRFLRFAVEHALSGTHEVLKEYLIGTEVYDRRPPYHPSQDSIVRTEARRLRSKLKEYYESEGKDDPIFIYFRPGSYVPVFRSKVALDSDPDRPYPRVTVSLSRARESPSRLYLFSICRADRFRSHVHMESLTNLFIN